MDLNAYALAIISTFDCEQAILQAVRAGAKAYLAKVADPQEIREAVRRVGRSHMLLSISEGTIKYHVKSILRKLNVIGRAEAIAGATKRG